MARRSKPREELHEEWVKATDQRCDKVRKKKQRMAVLQREQQNAAPKTHLRDAVLLFADLARCQLGVHYKPSGVAVPLNVLLRALVMDEEP